MVSPCDSWFNIEATLTLHPVIQMEVQDLIAQGAFKPLTGGVSFYSSMFVVHSH